MKKLLILLSLGFYFTGCVAVATCSKIKDNKCLVKELEVKKNFK